MAKLILLNKPFNVLSQFKDDQGRDTLKQFLPQQHDVYPAGRLDYDSEGLLLLTDSGALQHQISHPDRKQPKTYWAQVEGAACDSDLDPLRQGIELKDGLCRPAKVSIIAEPSLWPRTPPVRQRQTIPTSWLEITISEGRNRQVRRMTAAVGLPTLRLVRVAVGSWRLDQLQPGESKIVNVHASGPSKKSGNRNNNAKPRRSSPQRGRRL